ncbi:ABC-type amino acid transporter [Zopfochytrium polystomum]|nr:ABC-type amino acid transporter [Zopfochytrium polystomum]
MPPSSQWPPSSSSSSSSSPPRIPPMPRPPRHARAVATGGGDQQSASSALAAILQRGFLKVGMTGDYRPFSYLVKDPTAFPGGGASINTSYIGADVDMAQSLSNALSLPSPPQLVATTWTNLSADLSAGNSTITTQRAQRFFFTAPGQLLRVGKVACVRCADAAAYTSLADVDRPGVRVGVNPGGSNQRFDAANLHNATVVVIADNNAIYDMVANGTVDAMISDKVEVDLQVKLHAGVLCAVNSDKPFTYEQLGYMFPQDSALKNFVDVWLDLMIGSGSWDAILTKWLDYAWP